MYWLQYRDSKFKVGGHVKIPKYKNIFGKDYTTSWSDEVSVLKKAKNTEVLR